MRTRKQFRALLNRVHGYAAQVRRRMPARHAPRASQRAWTFAQAITARYAAIERRWPVMAFIFEQPGHAGVSVSNAYHITHPSIFISPRVILRMLVNHRGKVQPVAADRAPVRTLSAETVPILLAASPKQKLLLQEKLDVIARIVRRTVREEVPTKPNISTTQRVSGSAAQVAPWEGAASVRTPSLARVHRRVAKANNDVPAAASTPHTEKEIPRETTDRAMSVAASLPPSVDITRITDQVMQALDRRIVAQRERMGRV